MAEIFLTLPNLRRIGTSVMTMTHGYADSYKECLAAVLMLGILGIFTDVRR